MDVAHAEDKTRERKRKDKDGRSEDRPDVNETADLCCQHQQEVEKGENIDFWYFGCRFMNSTDLPNSLLSSSSFLQHHPRWHPSLSL